MRKTILFVSLLTVFLMLMIPNISAMQYQTIETAIEKETNTNYSEIFKEVLTLRNINDFSKKLITIFLFIIDALLIAGYYIAVPILLNEIAEIVFESSGEYPVISIVLAFLIGFIITGIAIIPAEFFANVIMRIGAWNEEILSNIHVSLLIVIGVILAILEINGITDLYPDSIQEYKL